MSTYRLNIDQSKYKSDHYNSLGIQISVIDVLIPLRDRYDSYDADEDAKYHDTTSSYNRERRESNYLPPMSLYSDQEFSEVYANDYEVIEFFEPYLNKSRPLKIQRWNLLRDREDGGASSLNSYVDKMGNLLTSYEQIVKSMPVDALDKTITVLTKEASFMGDIDGCRKCREDTENEDDEEEYYTDAEIHRHYRHLADSSFTVVPHHIKDDHNLFSGHDDQATTEMKLGDALNHSEPLDVLVMVAQVNIFSNRDDPSDASITVHDNGCVTLDKNKTNNADLSMLLPWVRLPSYMLQDDSIQLREINLWACTKDSKTGTHYDGHHNLLMVLCGTKTVELSPPDCYRGSPVHGDHANHPYLLRSMQVGGNLINEDFRDEVSGIASMRAGRHNIVVAISAGDAIFIPEGWWHRIESSANCIAVNVWFDHRGSSISSLCNKTNQHLLTYQAREMVRQFVDANIEQVNKSRVLVALPEMLEADGFSMFTGFRDNRPGRPMMRFLNSMSFGNIIPRKRKYEDIISGQGIIEEYSIQVLNFSDATTLRYGDFPTLKQLAFAPAVATIGRMIMYFIYYMDPVNTGTKKDIEEDRKAIIVLLDKLTSIVTTEKKRFIFECIIDEFMTPTAAYIMSVAWETHIPQSEAQASFASFFDCVGAEYRQTFMEQVESFRNESSKRLILGDLMLINPELSDEAKTRLKIG